MRSTSRITVASIATLALLVTPTYSPAAPAGGDDALHSRYFQMPSGNIACGFFNPNLRCDILSRLRPEPNRRCEVDWTGLNLDKDGRAGPVCAGDTVYNSDAPVLDYGRKWKRRGIVCRSRTTGLTCRNPLGHGFFLSRDSWDTL